MIEDPGIILRIDRTRLGSGIWAVRKPVREGLPHRRTRDVHRAWRFKTERRADNALKRLAWGKLPGVHPSHRVPNFPGVLFVVARVADGDLPRPRPDGRPAEQLALPFVTFEDLDRWSE